MLKYTGGGKKLAAPGIPARDLTDEEVKQYGGETELLKTGLYKKVSKKVKSNKMKRSVKGNK